MTQGSLRAVEGLTPFAGGFAKCLTETPVEIALVGKAGLRGNFRDREIRLAQKPKRLGDADSGDVRDKSHAGNLFENLHELGLAHVNQLSGLLDGNPFGIIQTHILE